MNCKLMLGLVGMLVFGYVGARAGEVANLTLGNLQKAYQVESSAKVQFEAFASQADKEGFKSVATLFRAAAKSETIHADKHAVMIKKLGVAPTWVAGKLEVKTTKENLEAAMQGKVTEKDTLYPGFIQQAKVDKHGGAEMSFMGASAAAGAQMEIFKKVLSRLDDWKSAGKTFGVCTVCGFVVMGPPPAKCPICSAPKDKFEIFK